MVAMAQGQPTSIAFQVTTFPPANDHPVEPFRVISQIRNPKPGEAPY